MEVGNARRRAFALDRMGLVTHSRRKALLVSGIYPPDVGGPAFFVPRLRRHLLQGNWDVRVVALAAESASTKQDVRLVGRGTSRLLRRWRLAKALWQESRGLDVIFANGLHVEVAAIAAIRSVPWVAKVVGEPIWERASAQRITSQTPAEFHEDLRRFSARVERWVWVRALERAAAVIVPSHAVHLLLRQIGCTSPISVVPNGVPQRSRHGELSERDFDLITVSRLVPLKRVDRLLKAADRLGLRLCVVGGGPGEAELRYEASQMTPPASVFFTGQVCEDQVDDFLDRSRVFCLLSDHEGLSFALLRAKAAGLPAVVTDVPGNRMAVREGVDGYLVRPGKDDELDRAIGALVGDPKKMQEFGAAAFDDVQLRFSLQGTLEKTEAELEAAIGSEE